MKHYTSIPDAPRFEGSNADQREGLKSAGFAMVVAPVVAIIDSLKLVQAAGEAPTITQNAARGAASESRVLQDMGLTKKKVQFQVPTLLESQCQTS